MGDKNSQNYICRPVTSLQKEPNDSSRVTKNPKMINKDKTKTQVHINYQNVRGLRTKCKELYLSAETVDFDR